MWELFVVGSFGFWLLVLAEFIALSVCMEYESGILATVSLIAFGAALNWMGGVNVIQLITANWYLLLPFIGAYVGLSIVWGIWKWRDYYGVDLEKWDEALYEWLKNHNLNNISEMTEDHKVSWDKWLENHKIYDPRLKKERRLDDTPQARANKARIMRWMAYWPISFLLYVFRDMVVKLFKRIYNGLAKYLQHMADQAFARTRDALPTKKPVPTKDTVQKSPYDQ
jgi:hypothetical protein